MNTNNANKEMGFDDFASCDYNKHWSYSNFNRMLIAAEQVSKLRPNAIVLELGAGSSYLKKYVQENFGREDIMFIKVDGDKQYVEYDMYVFDITNKKEWNKELSAFKEKIDCVVFMEVIEHLETVDQFTILDVIYEWLSPKGKLILTTPTPPYNKRYETLVWPDSHERECTNDKIYGIINKGFKITKQIGWSLEEREFNSLLEHDSMLSKVYCKLRCTFPEGYIRALIANLAPIEANRQVMYICDKRRDKNGWKTW